MTVVDFIIFRIAIANWAKISGYEYKNWAYHKYGKEYSIEEINRLWEQSLTNKQPG